MNTSIIVSIDMRRSKKDGTFPIILRLTHKRMTTAISTGINILPTDWDDKKKKVKNSYRGIDTVSRINNLIYKKQAEAFSIISKLEENGELNSLSIIEVKEKFSKKIESFGFLEYVTEQIKQLKMSGRFGSARAYYFMALVISKFIRKKDIKFQEINSRFLKNLETDYLSRGNSLNGLAAILRSFRACYNKGVQDGLIEKGFSPFEDYKIRKTPTVKRAISQESINSIMALELAESDPCFHARNYFLFSYLTFGMNFADMAQLTVNNIVDGRIHYLRQKTKQPFDLKIMDSMKPILEFYLKSKADEGFIFPIIKRSNSEGQYKDILWARRKYNIKLKEIAKRCNIEENLTSYVSRHSAATTALFLNIPLPAISKMMGHTSITTTQTYLKSLPSHVIDDYHQLLEKAMG